MVVCLAAVGIAVMRRSDRATPSGPVRVVRSSRFNVLPASLASRLHVTVVQVDADRAVVFGGVTWDKKSISVANDGVIVDFAKNTSTVLAGPKLDDGLVRVRAAVSGDMVLFFGMECAKGRLPAGFDGEGDVADPCVDAPLMLTTLDMTTGAWSDPVTAPAFVGGDVRWIDDASVVGHRAVIGWFESGRDTETFTAYDIRTGAWRALDSPPPGRLRDSCSTRTHVVQVTYDDWSESAGGVPPPAPRLLLLDPNIGQWTSVAVPHQFGPAVGGLACTANHPVVYGTPAPSFATVLFAYSPAGATWRLLPTAPHNLSAGDFHNLSPTRFAGIGDVIVGWRDPSDLTAASLSFQTIDLAQPEPRWSANATGPSAPVELATGSHGGGVAVTRADDALYRIVVGGNRG